MALGEFLKEIKKNPSSVKFAEMANILVIHCQAAGECTGPGSSTSLLVWDADYRFRPRVFQQAPAQLLAFFSVAVHGNPTERREQAVLLSLAQLFL